MKKKLSLALAILFTIFTLPINGISVKANDKTYDNIADGTYEAKYTVDYEGADFTKHFVQPATIEVKNGKTYLEFKHKDTKVIIGITRPDGKLKIIEEDESTRVVGFNIDSDLSEPVEIGLKMFYGPTHDVDLRIDLDTIKQIKSEPNKLDKNEANKVDKEDSKKEETDKSNKQDSKKEEAEKSDKDDSKKEEVDKTDKEDSKKEEAEKSDKDDSEKEGVDKTDKEDSKKEEVEKSDKDDSKKEETNKLDKKNQKKNKPLNPKKLDNGIYEAKYSVDYEGADFTKHFIQPATIAVKNGKIYLEFKHKDTQFINEITKSDGKVEIVEEDESTRVVGFNIDSDLSKPVKIGLKMFYGQTHDVNLRLDLETLKEVESEINILGGTELGKIESDNEDLNQTESDKLDNSIETEYDFNKVSDKEFTINFSIKHANGKDPSIADEYFKKPAMIIEKDGNMYAQLIITNGNMVKNLKTEYGEVNILKVNKDGSIVVQFKVKKDLSNMKLKMLISVPGIYTAEHDAILVFDKNSKELIKGNKVNLLGNGNNPKLLSFGDLDITGKGFNGLNSSGNDLYHKFGSLSQSNGSHFSGFGSSKMSTPNLNNKFGNTTSSLADGLEKPEFGSAGSDSQINQVSSNNNPKTGDTSLIWLYGILLVGSLAILVVKLRRRTI